MVSAIVKVLTKRNFENVISRNTGKNGKFENG